jgi:hypothetical protein
MVFLSPEMLDDTAELRAAWMEGVESLAKEDARVREGGDAGLLCTADVRDGPKILWRW